MLYEVITFHQLRLDLDSVAQWNRRDLDEICLAHCLRSADRVVSQLYNESLAPLGLRITLV